MLTYADVCWRMLTYVDVCRRMLRRHHARLPLPSRITSLLARAGQVCFCLSCTCPAMFVPALQSDACTCPARSEVIPCIRAGQVQASRAYSYICVLIPLYMCPHTTIYVSSCRAGTSITSLPLYMCPHTNICVLILLYVCRHTPGLCSHVPQLFILLYVSAFCICVLKLLHMCPHSI